MGLEDVLLFVEELKIFGRNIVLFEIEALEFSLPLS